MKKIIIITLIILNLLFYVPTIAQSKKLILSNKTIVIDPGHGSKDNGASFNDIYEKNINLYVATKLKKSLEKYGATIILTRDGDYDLSSPNTNTRKRSDFNNRIKLINEMDVDLVLSIHQNYYKDSKYKGTQIFYKDNKELADFIQKNINKNRNIKPIDNNLYMYNKINSDVLLIECGFISNGEDRKNLTNENYQKEYADKLAKYIADYYKYK